MKLKETLTLQDLLHYDLINDSSLTVILRLNTAKHIFVTELEIRIKDVEFNFMQNCPRKTTLVIDFMSLIRKIPVKETFNF